MLGAWAAATLATSIKPAASPATCRTFDLTCEAPGWTWTDDITSCPPAKERGTPSVTLLLVACNGSVTRELGGRARDAAATPRRVRPRGRWAGGALLRGSRARRGGSARHDD